MCIIAYIPKNENVSEETIRTMFRGNPDGAGLMWKTGEKSPVFIRKGFMKVEDLIKAYNDIPVDCERAIHCRIATAGKISVACCHPFPVRAKVSAMKNAEDKAEMALMHNGVISYANPAKGMKADYSDSMNFAAKFLYPLRYQLNKECVQTLIEESTPSRLLIFRQDAETIMLGNWECSDGVYYSNSSYKSPSAYYSKYFAGYDWRDYDCSYYGSVESSLYEYMYLDIGDDDSNTAVNKVHNAIESYKGAHPNEDIEYDVTAVSCGELYLETYGIPKAITSIGGYKITERGDAEDLNY